MKTLFALFVFCSTGIACASDGVRCSWEGVAQKYSVNHFLLYSIAKTESNLNPVAIGRNSNGSYDIGLMQINSSWLPKLRQYGITEEHLLDPCVSLVSFPRFFVCQKATGFMLPVFPVAVDSIH